VGDLRVAPVALNEATGQRLADTFSKNVIRYEGKSTKRLMNVLGDGGAYLTLSWWRPLGENVECWFNFGLAVALDVGGVDPPPPPMAKGSMLNACGPPALAGGAGEAFPGVGLGESPLANVPEQRSTKS